MHLSWMSPAHGRGSMTSIAFLFRYTGNDTSSVRIPFISFIRSFTCSIKLCRYPRYSVDFVPWHQLFLTPLMKPVSLVSSNSYMKNRPSTDSSPFTKVLLVRSLPRPVQFLRFRPLFKPNKVPVDSPVTPTSSHCSSLYPSSPAFRVGSFVSYLTSLSDVLTFGM